MTVNGQAAVILVVSEIEKLLKELRVQYADEKIKTGVVVGNEREQRDLLFSEARQIQFIGHGERRKAFRPSSASPVRRSR